VFIENHAHAHRHSPPLPAGFRAPEQLLHRHDDAGIEKGGLLE